MHLAERFWVSVTYIINFFSFSPLESLTDLQQSPLIPVPVPSNVAGPPKGPIFHPPGAEPEDDFTCDYSHMHGFRSCSTPEDRSCWLINDETKQRYDIHTNYEDIHQTPTGINRTYYLNLTDGIINADGVPFKKAKQFNDKYPGPWIQGCWGDYITVIVTNHLSHNGTSVHWHGIRQWKTMHMDGVNGVTQCPIAPGDYYNYTFRAMQYGSSWYHSHYSVQYADGAVGPMTLHGPASLPYDEPKRPLILTDWAHNSAFNATMGKFYLPSILLNGKGNVTRYNNNITSDPPEPHTIFFQKRSGGLRPKRYLLRIINTSFDSTFVFTIDNHLLTVIEADFVPIEGYTTTNILVGIGQRYHVVVEASPVPGGADGKTPPPADGNFWIRTYKAECFKFTAKQASKGYETTGILRYNELSTTIPTSSNWTVDTNCTDEKAENLVPVLPWTVGPPVNDHEGGVGENLSLALEKNPTYYPWGYFSLGKEGPNPLRVDYANPTFLNLNNTAAWNPLWTVVPEDYEDNSWVYMVIQGDKRPGKYNTIGAHPIHLHGHDFAILKQAYNASWPPTSPITLPTANPARRDVVLLPADGYVIIAFKTDNPGAWLVHCHIAVHASLGLGFQIMEQRKKAADIWPSLNSSHALQEVQRGCTNWNTWWSDCKNWWWEDEKLGGNACHIGANEASPDSGI